MTDYQYPIGDHHDNMVHTATGIALQDITLTAVMEGAIGSDDLTISGDTLLLQARVAEGNGYPHVAQNLRRAAELVRIPPDEILRVYSALRPRRQTYAGLIALAEDLEERYEAVLVAELIRDAANVYRERDLLSEQEEPEQAE